MAATTPQINDAPLKRRGRPTKDQEWAQQIADLNRWLADNTAAGELFDFEALSDEHPVVIEQARLIMEEGELTTAILRRLLQSQRTEVSAFVKRFFKNYTGWDI